ncbi:MAG: hypothetical protein Q8Q30_01280 [Candidatus Woesebacteria bacterium]|nr:hypothetical protein [Candidatus Woesebacteria bacterium]
MTRLKKNAKVGLTLMKIAPFHIGHKYLLDTALHEVDHLIAVIYDCPNLTDIPLNVRAGWIRKLYPQVEVIEGWDAPNQHEDTSEVKRMQEQYIAGVLKGRKITHFVSSEYYGEHMSKFLNAINFIIDMDRKKLQISSTMIRSNLYKYRKFIPTIVLKDLLTKVVILGAPSNENEKIVKEVSRRLETNCFPDISVKHLSQNNSIKPSRELDFIDIAQKRNIQRSNEKIIHDANESIIYSSSILMDYILSMTVNRKYDQKLHDLAREEISNYDLVFVNSDKTNIISKNYGIENTYINNQLFGNLVEMKIPYTLLKGNFEQKVQTIVNKVKIDIKSKKKI